MGVFKYLFICIIIGVYLYATKWVYLNILTLFFYKCVWLKPNK